MSDFRDILNQDMNVLFNTDEFAELVEINGVIVKVVEDKEHLERLKSKDTAGLISGDILIFITESEYSKIPNVKYPPQPGDALFYGSKPATITQVDNDFGVNQVILQITGARGWK